MNTVPTLLLGLGLLLAETPDADPARLREMLYDRQQPRGQSQAALLLVQARTPEADAIIRQGLCQTETPEQFQALAGALRLCRDARFLDDLLAGLTSDRAELRQAAVEAVAVLADSACIVRLQTLIDDPKSDAALRQAICTTLGRSRSCEPA